MTIEKKLLPGKIFELSGVEYTIPALSPLRVKKIQDENMDLFLKFRPIIEELDKTQKEIEAGTDTPETLTRAIELARKAQEQELDISCKTAYMAFSRNYPEVSYEDFLDLPNMAQVKEIAEWALAGEPSAKKN